VERIANFVGGEFSPPASGVYLDNVDPSTGTVYSQLPDSDRADLDAAVLAAEQAFPSWSRTSTESRSKLLLAIADQIDRQLEELARAESIDSGKPITLARQLDIPRASANFRFFARSPSSLPRLIAPVAKHSTTRCAIPSAWLPPSLPGIFLCTCSPGRSPRPSPPETV